MEQIAQHLLETIEKALPLLNQISDAEALSKPRPEKWSKKEILGHLIDSASNNQHKFVRTMQAEQHVDFVGYAQNFWVEAQAYNKANWLEVIALWENYNRHLAHIIRNAPTEKLENTISIEGSEHFTLRFIMEDYGEHLKHHLKQILPEAGFTSSFENLYNT
ncbi:MAG: DinB family protein [Phycisphaerae bacterium]|nr:DinB family protein [Saprospiraceae bacterium]